MKKCNKCKEVKGSSEFSIHKRAKDGLRYRCKRCRSVEQSLHRNTPEGIVSAIHYNQIRNSHKRKHPEPAYTKNQLQKWLSIQHKWYVLYDKWVNSGYDKWLKPSVDRINNNIGYTFENIQLGTWKENYYNAVRDRRNGKLKMGEKAVIGLNTETRKMYHFKSMNEAGRNLQVQPGGISRCCSGNQNQAGGYVFRLVSQRIYC